MKKLALNQDKIYLETSESLLLQLRDRIMDLPELNRSTTACIGFDGFVDTIQRAVLAAPSTYQQNAYVGLVL